MEATAIDMPMRSVHSRAVAAGPTISATARMVPTAGMAVTTVTSMATSSSPSSTSTG